MLSTFPRLRPDQHTFCVGQDSSRSVACMVDSSLGVWVTLKGSAHVCLYHPDTFEQLAEVDVTPPVHRMLAGTDLRPPPPLPSEPFCPIVEEAEPGPGSECGLSSGPLAPRLRRHHPAAQGRLPEDHGAAGVRRAAVGGHQRRRRAHHAHVAQHRQLPESAP